MTKHVMLALLTLTVTIFLVSYSKSLPAINPTLSGNNKLTPNMNLPARSINWIVYVNSTYHFRISHPNGFIVRRHNIAEFKKFVPTLIASIFFMNPTMATGALAEIEPPDLEVRVYEIKTIDSLKNWLISMGIMSNNSGAVTLPYRNSNISGLKICQSMMISPGCSIYVLRSSRVYQLTPISLEGEAMIETFMPLP